MKKEWSTTVCILSFTAGLVLGSLLVLIAIVTYAGKWDASQVQAIGSIIAIIASATLAIFMVDQQSESARQLLDQQRKDADDLKQKERIDVINNILGITEMANRSLVQTIEILQSRNKQTIDKHFHGFFRAHDFPRFIRFVRKIPLHNLPGNETALELTIFESAISSAQQVIENIDTAFLSIELSDHDISASNPLSAWTPKDELESRAQKYEDDIKTLIKLQSVTQDIATNIESARDIEIRQFHSEERQELANNVISTWKTRVERNS